MLVLGNQFGEETNTVTGVILRKRKDGDDNVSLWLNVDDKQVRRELANVLYRDVDIPDRIKWLPHSRAIENSKKYTPISRQDPV